MEKATTGLTHPTPRNKPLEGHTPPIRKIQIISAKAKPSLRPNPLKPQLAQVEETKAQPGEPVLQTEYSTKRLEERKALDAIATASSQPSLKIRLKIPQSLVLSRQPPEELCWERASPQPRRSHRARTASKTTTSSNRCACTDGCKTESCLNRCMLYECHSGNCSLLWCDNRPFTNPPPRALAIFDTRSNRGWGLRTDAAPLSDEFVADYTGRWRRWSLGWHSPYRMDVGRGWVLDAQYMKTQARYINHSCDPNCKALKWVDGGGNNRIGIFTVADVAAGTELTISYNSAKARTVRSAEEEGHPCLYESANCSGELWA